MSDSPHRGQPYPRQPPGPPYQGGPSYGAPPSQQGSQWQQPQQHGSPWQGGVAPQQQWQQQWQQPPAQGYDGGGYDAAAADLPLAPILRRAGARLIDNVLVAVFGFALIVPISVGIIGLDTSGSKASSEGGIWNWPIIFTLFAVLAVLPFLYEAVQLAMWGRTLGKRVLHLGVVQARPAGEPLTTTQAVWRAGVMHIGYQLGLFFFLALAVKVWDYFAYGMLLVSIGTVMAYLWAIWDQPLRQSLHDRFSGTLVIDERGEYSEYSDQTGDHADRTVEYPGHTGYEG
ncbi:RDD family protein [Actinomadura miaoliensis]|uniref:RDD domain-containing protein n=1 Tax=Actinomadura miaoliensis TaxID=430685 RepID=A0ABP7VYZ2_9ACTN